LALNAGALAASPAQTNSLRVDLAAADAHKFESAPTTVLVTAPNGSWGAATVDSIGVTTAAAIAHCKRMYRKAIGCGAYSTATLIKAEQAAIDRELELRRFYQPDLPPCVRLVSIDPSGAIVAPYVAELVRVMMDQRDRASR
jgi:hypothetical protein